MKTSIFQKSIFPALAIAMTCLIASCDNDDDMDDLNDQTYSLGGNAAGSQEVPAVTTAATGSLSGTYNARTNMLTYNITWTGLSGNISAAHFHGPALAGASAGPIHDITIGTNGTSGSTSGSITLADSTESHLLNGRLYYNLHTTLNPNGEIRGQVTATPN
jgi:hypothetical protein